MLMEKFRLEGKVAIVTGSSRGLGQAICVGMAEAGADILGVSSGSSEETGEKVSQTGRRFTHFQADLTKTDSLEAIVAKAVEVYGRVDILVNNAGIIRREDALAFTEKDWDEVMDINVKTVFFLSQAAAKQFVKQGTGGRIINIASMLSYQGGIRVPSYTASKHGVLGLTRALANEWACEGINVNAIAPGYMATDNTEPLRKDPDRSREILGRIPAGRWGTPEDLAGPAVFLASENAAYINGFTMAVDGGWLAR